MKIVAVSLLLLAPSAALAQDSSEIRFVTGIFSQIQPASFAENREYCGYIGLDDNDRWVATPIVRGKRDECTPEWPNDFGPIASLHTHAGFDREAFSEVPSVTDIESDEDEGVDGWLATPGGRLWFIDTTDMVVSQICGIGCIDQDPKFTEGAQGMVEISYTYKELLNLEAQ
jgi:hypothetical protein